MTTKNINKQRLAALAASITLAASAAILAGCSEQQTQSTGQMGVENPIAATQSKQVSQQVKSQSQEDSTAETAAATATDATQTAADDAAETAAEAISATETIVEETTDESAALPTTDESTAAQEEAAISETADTQEVPTTAVKDPVANSALDTSDIFSNRDLRQAADLTDAKTVSLASNEDVDITEEGIYIITGSAENTTITVNADDSAKVQLVLDNASISNSGKPAIYVASADKVFITTTEGSANSLTVSGTFSFAADEKADGAIFSRDDLTLNGLGSLTISSSNNGIVGKDDVKITGGTYDISAQNHGIQANDLLAVASGTVSVDAGKDALHCTNDEEAEKGSIYIADGTFNLKAASDGIGGMSITQIDGGTFTIESAEGIEGTYVQINDGKLNISASDDGINATGKSGAYAVKLEINGGDISINMGQGDTDALDANGDLVINGGTVAIQAQFAFDFDGIGQLNGGTVTVNGEQISELGNSMMGGGQGGMGGNMGGDMNGGMGGGMPGGRGMMR